MAVTNENRRGVQDIRTLSGQADQRFLPYKAFLRISCLEMERARRGKERDSALRRVSSIEARFEEIDAEKAALLSGLAASQAGDTDGTGSAAEPPPETAPGCPPPPQTGLGVPRAGRFKFRY